MLSFLKTKERMKNTNKLFFKLNFTYAHQICIKPNFFFQIYVKVNTLYTRIKKTEKYTVPSVKTVGLSVYIQFTIF